MDESKKCNGCGKEKARSEFYPRRDRKNGLTHRCKSCSAAYRKQPHVRLRKNLQRRKNNATTTLRALQRERRMERLSLYSNLLKIQKNKCAICLKPETVKLPSGKVKALAFDHNHTTGQMRGLLCYRCNTTLGKVNEDVKILDRMIGYINEWKKKSSHSAHGD